MIISFYFISLLCISIYASSEVESEISNQDPMKDKMKIEYESIGVFHSELTPATGAPRQGSLQPENQAVIEIYDEYAKALHSLDDFEYIIVLYHLDKSRGWHAMVSPPGSKRAFGMFATRTPNRPNPIGFGVIKLDKMEGTRLYVSGVDAYDGTPVLDIKPWLPSIDCPSDPAGRELEQELGID